MDYFLEYFDFAKIWLGVLKEYLETAYIFLLKNVFPPLYRLEALIGVSLVTTAFISYKIGSKLARSKILIDKNLREKFENVEITKKKYMDICKRSAQRIAIINTLLKLLYLLACLLVVGYFFYPMVLVSVLPWVEPNPFLLFLILVPIVLFYILEKVLKRKRDENQKKFQLIQEESFKVSEKILDLLGPQLGDLLKNHLLQKELENPKCKPLCEMKTHANEIDLRRHQNFLRKLASFNWCPFCTQFYNHGEPAANPDADRPDGQNLQQGCLSNCFRRYFRHCSEIGREFNERDKELEEERAKIAAEEKKSEKKNEKKK